MKETGPSFDWKFVSSDNSVRNIWKKLEKFSKTGQEKKSLISTFARFFECYYQSLISEMETGHWALCLHQIWDFFNISLFPKILSLKSFRNLWGNSYTKFATLGITFRFACS